MRTVAAILAWLVATFAFAVAVPTNWAQRNIVDVDGYTRLAEQAAGDPRLQQAAADQIADTVVDYASGVRINRNQVRGLAAGYTSSQQFPGQFGDLNRIVHRWMFTDSVQQRPDGTWMIDIAPMLDGTALKEQLDFFGVRVPSPLNVPVTLDTPEGAQPGQLKWLATWGPPVSIGSAVLAAVFAVLTLAVARARGKALVALGISALLVGAGGYALGEVSRAFIDRALDKTGGSIRTVADVMVDHAEGNLHGWLNLTLAAGAVAVVLGIVAAVVGGMLRKKNTPPPAPPANYGPTPGYPGGYRY